MAIPFLLPGVCMTEPGSSQPGRVRTAVHGLNQLAAAKANSEFFRTSATTRSRATQLQEKMLAGISRRVDRLGPEPDITPEAALRELLAGRDTYSCDPMHIAPFDEDLRCASERRATIAAPPRQDNTWLGRMSVS